MKQRLLDFIEKLSKKRKIQLAILIFIIGMIAEFFIIDLWIEFFGPTKAYFSVIPLMVVVFFIAYLEWFFVEDIMYENRQNRYEKIENEAHERLKSILTNEFKTFSLKTDGDYDYFTKILVKEVPYVFKARMENDIIYYQFETKDGEIFYSGEFTGYSFFEKHVEN